LHARRGGDLRTLYIKENRLVGFQLVGDIHAAGVLRTLIVQGQDLSHLKQHLLDPNFGQGALVWEAMADYV
jgi:NAD(P)H-nitrite reductase large subunit